MSSTAAPSVAEDFDFEVLLNVLSDVEAGDFTARMPVHWTGMGGKVADRLNGIITANQAFGAELGRVSRVVGKEGKLSQRVSFTGYSSLVYLQRLPVTEIKADRSFVRSMATIDDDAVIVRSIIDLAHNLGMKVVAEGVEDEVTMDLLIAYGCDEVQGYYFSRPLPAEDIAQWFETSAFGLPRRMGGYLTGVPHV